MKKYKYEKTKLIHGIGFNDADYAVVEYDINRNIIWRCPFYTVWYSMIRRCYSGKQRCYEDCSVIKEWHYFLNFKKWMIKQKWYGNVLDKDILIIGNKIYSPDTCIFVMQDINKLFNLQNRKRGKYAIGVSASGNTGKFRASIRIYGKNKHLGVFDTEQKAKESYLVAKSNHIRDIAKNIKDEKLKLALLSNCL